MIVFAKHLRYPLLLAIVVICFFWKLWLTNQYTWLQAPDFANQLMPWYQFQASEWHAGRIPLWNPYEWTGQSLIGQAQPGVVDPFNLILYAAPLTPNGWLRQDALHWFFIAGYVAAALAFFAFCRRGLHRSEPASFVAALAYSLGGIPSSTNWPQMMHATVWGPLGLLYQFRAVREDKPLRHGALSGMFLGLMWLSGHHQIPLYFTLASAGFWIYFLYTRFVTKRGLLRSAALAGLFLLLFGALQILPMAEYGRNARRWVGTEDPVGWQDAIPYAIHQQFSLRPLGLLNVVLHASEPYESFMGVTAVALAVIGAIAFWRRQESVRWLTCLGVCGILYALGANSFVHGVLYAFLPAIEKARVPAVAMVLLNVAAAGLAAFGLDHLGSHDFVRHKPLAAAFGALAGLALLFLMFFKLRIGDWPVDWLYATGALAMLAAMCFVRPRWAPAALGLTLLLELSSSTVSNWPNQNKQPRETFLERLGGDADVAAFLQRAPGTFRINHSSVAIPFSFGDYWGFETVESFTASVPAPIWDIDVFDPALRDFASVRYDVADAPVRASQIERFRSKTSALKVYENLDVYPRAWLVHRVQAIAEPKQAKGWMKTQGAAKFTEAIVYGSAPALTECSADAPREEISFTRRAPNELRLRVKAGCRAMLIVNDAWDPGWKAYVDGKSAKVWQADGFVRGVVLDGGDHEVRLVFRPNSVLIGLACLLAGFAGLVWIWRKDAVLLV